jgi:type I restriction enzyme M protein
LKTIRFVFFSRIFFIPNLTKKSSKYFKGNLKTIGQDELTTKFKQAHNALWGGGELDPAAAFDELDKLIFCKIWDEKNPRKKLYNSRC